MSIKTSLKGPSINVSGMFEDVKIPEVASDEETTDLSVVVGCSAVDSDSGYNVDDFKEGSAMEDEVKIRPNVMFATNTSKTKMTLSDMGKLFMKEDVLQWTRIQTSM